VRRFLLVLVLALNAGPVSGQPAVKEATSERRARLSKAVPEGLVIIQSADRSQPNLLEFMLPDTENHDFIYLTGLESAGPRGSTLVLNPRGETFREILYTSDDPDQIRQETGITQVLPQSRFLDDLSSAITDYRNLRITQLRFKPVASDLSRGLGLEGVRKVIYLNYPRFTNLGEPANPRFALAARLREASPEIELRDSAELLDPLRMIHDEVEIALIRRAVNITAKGLTEAMKVARPGATTKQVAETMDYVYRLNGGGLAFDTSVRAGQSRPVQYATAREEDEARSGSALIRPGDFVHIDTGAEFNHYASDVQRMVPADGRFTPEQRKTYGVILNVQKTVIDNIKPGARWQDLHNLAVKMLKDAGGWDTSYTYGIGHFVGMEVHDHGDYLAPLQPGMALTIEQGATVEGVRVALEDTVLVTRDGHEWLSRMIPIETDEVEKLLAEPPVVDLKKLLVGRER
jgi:Xaa-Pro aminopeptidase